MKTKVFIKRKPTRNSAEDFSCTFTIGNQFFPLSLKPNDTEFLSFLLNQNEEFVKAGEVELPLFIEKRNFTDKDEKVVEYISYEISVQNVTFELKPEVKHKRLLGYLLEKEGV